MEDIERMIGKKVRKISGRPFKSTQKINTVKGIQEHPNLPGREAFYFEEDNSFVLAEQCIEC